ncbi:YitT family protein [Paenibacillus sp. N3/727]|uniref:YitT family protein n=1 Tax=Paenibacillus sp. N3/727 TaxID=2925845 RepID=UPI001F536AE2|nr:YitT family protein [Paenibacillus sp. N3/727]UNK17371.1 YitT family protein [Paenibacillus sp. N3/727]
MQSIIKYFIIIIGSILIAAGTNFFLVPYKVLDGGVIGIALITNYLFDLHIGFVIILCSIPMFMAAWLLNRAIFYNSLTGMLISSFVIDLLSPLQPIFHPYLDWGSIPSASAGGFLIGTGLGIMLRFETSTGGTDLLAHFLARRIPLNVGVIILLMDAIIIGIGGLLLSGSTFVLSIFTIISGGIATGLCTMKRWSRKK